MGLSQDMIRWITDRVSEAMDIVNSASSHDSLRAIAEKVLRTWSLSDGKPAGHH
jgi:hypothetical protein